jgi:hypothetical protein
MEESGFNSPFASQASVTINALGLMWPGNLINVA